MHTFPFIDGGQEGDWSRQECQTIWHGATFPFAFQFAQVTLAVAPITARNAQLSARLRCARCGGQLHWSSRGE